MKSATWLTVIFGLSILGFIIGVPTHAWLVGLELEDQRKELEAFVHGLPQKITVEDVRERLARAYRSGTSYVDSFPIIPGPKTGASFLLFQYAEPRKYWLGLVDSDVILVCSFDEEGQLQAAEVHVRTSSL